jgi:hypothetical protein
MAPSFSKFSSSDSEMIGISGNVVLNEKNGANKKGNKNKKEIGLTHNDPSLPIPEYDDLASFASCHNHQCKENCILKMCKDFNLFGYDNFFKIAGFCRDQINDHYDINQAHDFYRDILKGKINNNNNNNNNNLFYIYC